VISYCYCIWKACIQDLLF